MVCKTAVQTGFADWSIRFNPCYVGLWSVSEQEIREKGWKYSFQSLLCWIMVCKELSYWCPNAGVCVSILVMLDYGL